MGRDTKLLKLLVALMFLLTAIVLSSFPTSSPVHLKPLGNATAFLKNVKLTLQVIHLVVIIIVNVLGILAIFGMLYRNSKKELSYIQKFGIKKES